MHAQMNRFRPASLVAPVAPAAGEERWASLDDPYTAGYTPSYSGGSGYADPYSDGGRQLIDPVAAVSGLTGSLWTSRAGESLAGNSGPRIMTVGARVKASELPTLVYRDDAPSSSKSPRAANGVTPKLLTAAFSVAGAPFRQGQASPQAGFDNTGFVTYVYSQAGIRLPRRQGADDMVAAGNPVSKDDLRPGDMVVYRNPKSQGAYLLGIFSGNGNFILASPRLNVVTETAAFGTDYGPYFVGGRRLYDDPAAAPLSDEAKMAVTNGAVMTALSNLGEIPRMDPAPAKARSYKAKGKAKGKGKARAASSKGKGKGKKYSTSSGKSSGSKAKGTTRRVVKKKKG
jgi:cell wall-associated NlpC family hydrolase